MPGLVKQVGGGYVIAALRVAAGNVDQVTGALLDQLVRQADAEADSERRVVRHAWPPSSVPARNTGHRPRQEPAVPRPVAAELQPQVERMGL